MSPRLLARSPCFWFALAGAAVYALIKVHIFRQGSVGDEMLQALQLVLVMMAAWFPGVRVSTSPGAAAALADSVRRQSIPPPPPALGGAP